MTMIDQIKMLIEGNKQFRKTYFTEKKELFSRLSTVGQQPKVMVIACSDSRIDPAIVFNCQPGQLFVVRNVANLVPPCEYDSMYHGTSAALEFGTCFLLVEHIIILGHSQCGGIRALVESNNQVMDTQKHNFIATWMSIAQAAYQKVMKEHGTVSLEEKIVLSEQYAMINSLKNLLSFDWIKERVNKKSLTLHAWYFDLATGLIHAYDQQSNQWNSLD